MNYLTKCISYSGEMYDDHCPACYPELDCCQCGKKGFCD